MKHKKHKKSRIPYLWDSSDVIYINAVRATKGNVFVDYPLPAISYKISLFSLPKSHCASGRGSNLGVIATQDIQRGEIIGYYAGIIEPDRSNPFNAYIMIADDDGSTVCNAFSCGNELRYINDYNGIYDSPNVYVGDAVPLEDAPEWVLARPLIAICSIEKGNELVSNYGKDYWEMLKTAYSDPTNRPLPVRKIIIRKQYSYQIGDVVEVDMTKLEKPNHELCTMQFTIVQILDNEYYVVRKNLKLKVSIDAISKCRGSIGESFSPNEKVQMFSDICGYKGWWAATILHAVADKNGYCLKCDVIEHYMFASMWKLRKIKEFKN